MASQSMASVCALFKDLQTANPNTVNIPTDALRIRTMSYRETLDIVYFKQSLMLAALLVAVLLLSTNRRVCVVFIDCTGQN